MILFIARCDKILIDYIIASLADALIIGSLNALFMSITGMEYVGLISVVVGYISYRLRKYIRGRGASDSDTTGGHSGLYL